MRTAASAGAKESAPTRAATRAAPVREAAAERPAPGPGLRTAGEGGGPAMRAARAVEGGGASLPAALRRRFEPRFGASLSAVRVHAGPEAGAAARGLGAQAYALGPHIAFAPGRYAPGTAAGLHLIGHELAHVAQSGAAPARGTPALGAPGDAAEREAEGMAGRALAGLPARPARREAPGVIRRFSGPQHVPERTYIAGQDPENDGFLRDATRYREQWGLNPQSVDSLADVVDDLEGGQGRIGRIRIVTHASQNNLYMSLFEGGPVGILEGELRAYAQSQEAGGAEVVLGGGRDLMSAAFYQVLLDHIRGDDPDVPAPFGLDAAGAALSGVAGEFFRRAGDLLAYREAGQSEDDRRVREAVETRLGQLAPQLEEETQPGGDPITAAQVTALRAAVLTVPVQNLSLGAQGARITGNLSAAETAADAGFYADLASMRARFDATSWVDIRGCRVGESASYLEAIAEFFGRPDARPHVSGPDRFQSFPSLGYRVVTEREIPGLARQAHVRAALDHWFDEAGILQDLRRSHAMFVAQLALIDMGAPMGRGFAPEIAGPPERHGGGMGVSPMFAEAERRAEAEADEARLRAEIERIEALSPAEKLRFHFERNMALPVIDGAGGRPNYRRLLVMQGREDASLRNWLDRRWSPYLPPPEQLRQMEIGDEEPRQVAALQRDRTPRVGGTFVIAPDSRYRAHIKTI